MMELQRPRNVRNDGEMARSEWAIGSLPVGSWVDLYNTDDVLVYRGWIREQRTTWGYTVVEPVTEGDGNFLGAVETGTLQRIYGMSDRHYVQAEAPATWLGVDEELVAELAVGASKAETSDGSPVATTTTAMPLSPVVSLVPVQVPEEVD